MLDSVNYILIVWNVILLRFVIFYFQAMLKPQQLPHPYAAPLSRDDDWGIPPPAAHKPLVQQVSFLVGNIL